VAVKGLQLNITSKSFGGSSLGGGTGQSKINSASLFNSSPVGANAPSIRANTEAISINAKKITLLKNIFKAQEPFGGNEDPLQEVNQTLEEIGVILALDFTRRKEEAKEEALARREEKVERKRSMKERMIEGLKGAGKRGMGAAKGVAGGIGGAVAASPVGDIFGSITKALTLLGAAKFANSALDWLKDEKNQEKVANFFKFIADHWKWVLGAVAGVAALGAIGGLVSVITGLTAAIGIFANPLAWKILAAIAIGYGIWEGGKWITKRVTGGGEFAEFDENLRQETENKGLDVKNFGTGALVLGADGEPIRVPWYGKNGILGREAKPGKENKNASDELNLINDAHRAYIERTMGKDKLKELDEAYARYLDLMGQKDNIKDQMHEQIGEAESAIRTSRSSGSPEYKTRFLGDHIPLLNIGVDNSEYKAYQQETLRLVEAEEAKIRERYSAILRGVTPTNASISSISKNNNTAPLSAVEYKGTITHLKGITTTLNRGDIQSDQTEDQSKVETINPVNVLNDYMTETPELHGII